MNFYLTREFWLGSSPKTSIYGIIKGIAALLVPIFNKQNFNINTDWPFILAAILFYFDGRSQKDSNGLTRQEDNQVHQTVKTIENATISN